MGICRCRSKGLSTYPSYVIVSMTCETLFVAETGMVRVMNAANARYMTHNYACIVDKAVEYGRCHWQGTRRRVLSLLYNFLALRRMKGSFYHPLLKWQRRFT